MLEIQIEQRSRDINASNTEQESTQKEFGQVYFNTEQAIQDFEKEAGSEVNLAFPQVDPQISHYLKHANVLVKHDEYGLAMNLLRQASNKDSKNPEVLSLIAHCLEKQSRLNESLIARKALVAVDYGFENLYHYGTTLYKLGRDQEALESYYEALSVITEENSALFELYKNMGNIFVRQGDFDGAEEFYNKAYTVNSQSDVLLVNYGTLEVQRSDYDKSLYCFRKAVDVNPTNDKAWVGLAMVHNEFGDIELAWANIESALDINPTNRTAVHLAANWGLRDSKVEKAIEYLQQYLASVEQDEDMSLVLINLFCSIGHLDKALLEMERVLLWNPDHNEVRQLKKKILRSQRAA